MAVGKYENLVTPYPYDLKYATFRQENFRGYLSWTWFGRHSFQYCFDSIVFTGVRMVSSLCVTRRQINLPYIALASFILYIEVSNTCADQHDYSLIN